MSSASDLVIYLCPSPLPIEQLMIMASSHTFFSVEPNIINRLFWPQLSASHKWLHVDPWVSRGLFLLFFDYKKGLGERSTQIFSFLSPSGTIKRLLTMFPLRYLLECLCLAKKLLLRHQVAKFCWTFKGRFLIFKKTLPSNPAIPTAKGAGCFLLSQVR